MPNHCENHTNFQGSRQDIEAIFAIIKGDGSDYKISNLVPMPQELREVEARFSDDAKVPGWVEEKYAKGEMTADEYNERVSEAERLSAQYASNRAKYGHKDWYDWANDQDNWGTKWGDYDHFSDEVSIEQHDDGTCGISFSYQTAWGPFSDNFWLRISEQFPNVWISSNYAEPGMCFMGAVSVRGGVIFSEYEDDAFGEFPEDDENFDSKYMEYLDRNDQVRNEIQDKCDAALHSYETNNTRKEGV